MLKVFEVKVGMAVNEENIWKSKDEIVAKARELIEKKRIREEEDQRMELVWAIERKVNKYKCYFNSSCKPRKIRENMYAVPCFISNENYVRDGTGNQALLVFDTNKKYISEERILRNFNIPFNQGSSVYSTFEVNGDIFLAPFLQVNSFYDIKYSLDLPCLVKRVLSASSNADSMIEKYLKTFYP